MGVRVYGGEKEECSIYRTMRGQRRCRVHHPWMCPSLRGTKHDPYAEVDS